MEDGVTFIDGGLLRARIDGSSAFGIIYIFPQVGVYGYALPSEKMQILLKRPREPPLLRSRRRSLRSRNFMTAWGWAGFVRCGASLAQL